jgi:hypothetical protein
MSLCTSYAGENPDFGCEENPDPAIYTKLVSQAQKNDVEAMYKLSTLPCCSKTCAAESVKWLKTAAAHGHTKAQQLLVLSKDPDDENEFPDYVTHLYQEQKINDYIFRSYKQSVGGGVANAYFEILKNDKVVFSQGKVGSSYSGEIYKNSILNDAFPSLMVDFYDGTLRHYYDQMVFSLNKTGPKLKLHSQYNEDNDSGDPNDTRACYYDVVKVSKDHYRLKTDETNDCADGFIQDA